MAQSPGSEESLDFLFARMCRLKHARVRTLLEALGLYRGQPSVLRALWEQEGLTHTQLAKRLHVQPATITKMITRMEKAGFVERRQDPEDQRIWHVYLTETGRSIQAQVHQVWRTLESEAFAGFTLQEQTKVRGFFLRIRENLMRVTGGK